MAQQCLTCAHPEIEAINIDLASGKPSPEVAERYGVSVDSLKRHRNGHLTPALIRVAGERRNEASAVPAHERLEALYDRASALLSQAEAKGSVMGGAAVLRELRQIVETLAKLSGELDERPTVTVNLLSTPEVVEFMTRLLAALEPFPEARVAAAAVIDVPALEAGS